MMKSRESGIGNRLSEQRRADIARGAELAILRFPLLRFPIPHSRFPVSLP
jgi:hypothetical protein